MTRQLMEAELGHGASETPIDLWTVAMIAVVVYTATAFIHEGVGHGLAATLRGARVLQVSTVDMRYDAEGLSAWDNRFIAAAGTGANLLAGLIALAAAHFMRRATAATRYFFWLFGHVNLFTAGGYPMVLGFVDPGDWGAFTRGLPLRPGWQIGVTLFGVAVSFAALGSARRGLQAFLGLAEPMRQRRSYTLTLWPYLVGGTVSTVASLFNPAGASVVTISAMGATFGGTAFLAWLPKFIGKPRSDAPEITLTPTRSPCWLALGAVFLIVDLVALAPGLPR